MKTWYCVTSAYYDNGKITAGITATMESEHEPETTFDDNKNCDIYHDWFDSKAEAEEFIKNCRRNGK